ncbi:TetR/AcrR family transcriptional regulator [Streptomyces sp. CMB-StM0423]|uniref:TetR/AcrR family transcriptional regulator n=1 Tax=Streptomyces sp. CMB-StM0423 TaxID=2059884 RepID=UPI000C714B68|nr:TetR/AcrR family transcriptional regulator [Streptomyces sp. CMB-StM0423]AUH42014.1 TetR/AcrR family transcriptional regulator [Streptomyces sp. CMB-StM0423]
MASVRRKVRGARVSIWLTGRAKGRRRGYAPAVGEAGGLDLGKIVAATVRLLDAEGLGRLSMRRLAAELGVTAMSVYWYVDTKDELLELALDHAYAQLDLPDEDGVDWAAQLRQLAHGHRRILVAHPWVSRLAGEYLNVGPHAMACVAAAQRAMRRAGLPEECLTGGLSLLFPFSYGFGGAGGRLAEPGEDYGAFVRALREHPDFIQPPAAGGCAVSSEPGPSERVPVLSGHEQRDRDFAFALECVLAGMAAMRDRVAEQVRPTITPA